jgi:3D (Asp-Asp-Asp) domain-containing protein
MEAAAATPSFPSSRSGQAPGRLLPRNPSNDPMKKTALALTSALLSLLAAGHANTTPAPAEVPAILSADRLKVRTTAYTATEPNGGGRFSAIGTRLRHGGEVYSAASDWSWLPLGTIFRMKETGRTYRIEDYGSALVGRKTIDLFMPSNARMHAWGMRHVNIEIIKMGCFQRSLDVLRPRQKARHVRKMVAALRTKQLAAAPLLAGGPSTAPALGAN